MIHRHLVILVFGAVIAESALAETYQLAVTYQEPVPQPGHTVPGRMQPLATAGGARVNINFTPDALTRQRIRNNVARNILIPPQRFKQIYGVTPEALAAADVMRRNHPGIRNALPVGLQFQPTGLNQAPHSPARYSGRRVSQWQRQQHDMGKNNSRSHGIDAPGAWHILHQHKLSPAWVAIIDTGIAPFAPYDVKHRLDYDNSWNISDNNGTSPVRLDRNIYAGVFHGTHVGGTIVADGPNVTGVSGPLNKVGAYALRAIANGGSNEAVSMAELWAVNQHGASRLAPAQAATGNLPDNPHPARVLNQSYGISRFDQSQAAMTLAFWIKQVFIPVCQASGDVNRLVNKTGAVQVMAAGNDAQGIINDVPSGCPNIQAIVVEATRPDGRLTTYSSYYNNRIRQQYQQYRNQLYHKLGAVDLQSIVVRAPGGNSSDRQEEAIYNTVNCPGSAGSDTATPGRNLACYGYSAGTSMATPHVSGIVSMIYALKPQADVTFVSRILKQSTDHRGVLNAREAVTRTVSDIISTA